MPLQASSAGTLYKSSCVKFTGCGVTRQQKQFELAGIVRNRIVERQMLRPGDLLDHPGQWRDHTDAQAQAMAGILREVGIASTLKAWRSERAGGGLVTWDGHLRKSLDPDLEWPVDILDITDAEADYLLSVFDPVSAMATADAGALDALLSSVQSGEAAVQAMLAELAEGAGLYAAKDDPQDADPQVDRAEELREQWGVEPGQIWRLPSRTAGQEHRLICGDSLSDGVPGVMEGLADLVVSDPPYAIYGSSTGIGGDVTDNNMVRPFMRDVAGLLVAHVRLGGHCYLFCDWRSYATWFDEIKRRQLAIRNCIVWDKGDGGLGSNYTMRHEFAVFIERLNKAVTMTEAAKARKARVVHGLANVQRFNVPQNEDRQHNAAKPVDLLMVFIRASSDEGDVVLDPFLGSGTTLIAAENLGRQCRAVEISPGYVAVALERYYQAFQIRAELITDGRAED
jgi:DNA modification methylase